jgi:hypothetical protein
MKGERTMNADEAWAKNKDTMGEFMHRQWIKDRLELGFADHQYVSAARFKSMGMGQYMEVAHCNRVTGPHAEPCEIPEWKHSRNMVPWAMLPKDEQRHFVQNGEVFFKWGFKIGEVAGSTMPFAGDCDNAIELALLARSSSEFVP